MSDRATLPTPAVRAHASPGHAVALVLVAAFMVLADVSIVNTAAPAIQNDLGAGLADVQLIVAGYQVGYATLLVTGGRLGDIAGRRAIFSAGLLLFTLTSLACGLAPSPGVLIAARVAQGLSAGLLYPQVLATIQTVLTPERRPAGFAALGAVISLATIAGPILAGALVTLDIAGTSWRAVFLINVPIGLVALILAQKLVPATRAADAGQVSVASVVMLSALLVALMAPLTVGRDHGWPVWAWVSLAATVPLAWVFRAHQGRLAARGRTPLLPPGLWRDRAFRLGVLLYFVFFSALYSFFLYFSYLLQYGLGESALQAGLSMVAYSIGSFLTSTRSKVLTARYGGRTVALAGAVTSAAGSALMIIPVALVHDPTLSLWIIPPLFVTGCGLGLVLAPLLGLVLAGIRSSQAGAAAGLLSTSQQIGGATGIAVIGLAVLAAVPEGRLENASAEHLANGFSIGLGVMVAVFLASAVLVAKLPKPADT
ncbi:MFS transporter [Actinomadura rudentiformis]|uniref:MFS transporter n=1 Tax=Actinomadura rudentiformis TaxID=359158 RepID=A0A6H9YT42_9ACTN|nr:MFS transporter [Actinomadura rudentiformis]KAB2345181.1 MFS transporter [Actinomadura rudentiformis]